MMLDVTHQAELVMEYCAWSAYYAVPNPRETVLAEECYKLLLDSSE